MKWDMPSISGQRTKNEGQKTEERGASGDSTEVALSFVSEASVVGVLKGTLLAFDFGTKRIGVAVGNSISATAQPLITLHCEQNEQRFASIAGLIKEWEPAVLVVGVPCYDDGIAHEMTRLCKRFANRLKGRFSLPVILVDERFTSTAASSQLNEAGIRGIKQKPLLDQIAAQQILQAYFDEPVAGIYA